MIAHLSGKIIYIQEKTIILSVNHVGYAVSITEKTQRTLTPNQEIALFIHSQIREDAFDLYGFTKYQELQTFKKLISINGIGPKVAMEISNIDTAKLENALEEEDLKFIKSIPGIGLKTAQRLILELKGKLNTNTTQNQNRPHQKIDAAAQEIIDALTQMGYPKKQIIETLKTLPKDLNQKQIITHFLKNA